MSNDRGRLAERVIRWMIPSVLLLGMSFLCPPGAWGADRSQPLIFERDIWPMVAANCAGCHGADRPKGDLDLRSVSRMLRGGKSGPALDRADPESSLLLERITQGEMPPGKARKLSPRELSDIRSWILGGACADHPETVPLPISPVRPEARQFWSFQPLRRPSVPILSNHDLVRHPR